MIYLDEIRPQFEKGGTITDKKYKSILRQVANENWFNWGDESPQSAYDRILTDSSYDYRGYYNKYPNSRANASTHWTDEFKGASHPTFSDESVYHGKYHPKFNPNKLTGGHWVGEGNYAMFMPPEWNPTYSREDVKKAINVAGLDIYHTFGKTKDKFQEFAGVMKPIISRALENNGYSQSNLDNIVRQTALESNYGLDALGSKRYNLGGIKWQKTMPDRKYTISKKDNLKYADFDDLYDYANFKVQLLNNRYDAINAANTEDFIEKLHTKGKPNYSADKASYKRNLINTKSLNKYLLYPIDIKSLKTK